jgi:hypothetical protein
MEDLLKKRFVFLLHVDYTQLQVNCTLSVPMFVGTLQEYNDFCRTEERNRRRELVLGRVCCIGGLVRSSWLRVSIEPSGIVMEDYTTVS